MSSPHPLPEQHGPRPGEVAPPGPPPQQWPPPQAPAPGLPTWQQAAATQPGPAPTAALEIDNLGKQFGQVWAVDNLTLRVPAGSLFGLVGPNGAGKTTTLSMCTGLLRPTCGQVRIWGHDVWSDPTAAKAQFGVLPDGLRLFDRLTGLELVTCVGRLRGLDAGIVDTRAHELLDALGLTGDADKLVCDYSAGMTKKIGLACALVHNPRLLILDEPFEAVDPVSGQAIRQILHEVVATGGTVVLSSHVMELVESMCDAVAVVAHGRVLAAGTLDQVRQGHPLQERFIELVGGARPGTAREGLSWLGHSPASN